MPTQENEPLPKPGDRVGKYALTRVIGEGGMGVVFEAEHVQLRSRVAIKMLSPKARRIPNIVTRFEREARAAGQLRSPFVVRILDVDATTAGLPYLVMELLEGRDLANDNAWKGARGVEEAVGIALQVADAMGEAHSRGIVHRDLKPSNIFLTTDGERLIAKVLDFGISKVESLEQVHMTTTNAIIGTPLYMSPEQVRSSKAVDPRSDIWALGVILYEMLSGQLPFEGDSATSLAVAIVSDPFKPIEEVVANLPDGFAETLGRALAKRPDDRYPDMATFAAALAPFAGAAAATVAARSSAAKDLLGQTGPLALGSGNGLTPLPPRILAIQRATTLSGSSIAGGSRSQTGTLRNRIARSPSVRIGAIAGFGAIIGMVATVAMLTGRTSPPQVAPAFATTAVPVPPPSPVSRESTTPAIVAPDPVAVDRLPAAPLAPPAAAAPQAKRPSEKPAAKPAKSCTPPYYTDAAGHRQYKPECL